MKRRVIVPGIPDTDPFAGRQGVESPVQIPAESSIAQPDTHRVAPVAEETIGSSSASSGKDIRRLNPNQIEPNPFAPREIYTAEMLHAMAESIRTKGQREVIHVIPHPISPDRFIIGDGWTRVQACRDFNAANSILAEVHHDLSPQNAAWFGYDQNEERNEHTDLDRARFYAKQQQGGMSQSALAARVGRSKSDLTRFLAFLKLPESILSIVEANAGRVGANAAYQLLVCSERAGERRAAQLAQKFIENNQSVRWLTDQVFALTEPAPRRGPVSQRRVRYANGYFRQANSTYKLEITVDPDKQTEFEKGLESLLATVSKPIETGAGHRAHDPEGA